jgi:single-stranded-DNA-specific exonuclease
LDALKFELADAIEQLAPFGPGNPALILATRGVRPGRVSQIGKNKEHLKFTVQDGSGREQSVLWWNADRADLPEAQFDLAYTLRAGSFRGTRQLNLEFVELRLTEAQPVEIRRAAPEVLDLRREPAAADRLGAQVLVWAEGEDGRRGQGRATLHPAEEFAIWTAPPSAAELRSALQTVQPQRVYFFAIPPAQEKAEDFLKRLAGLSKYALNRRGGRASLVELAIATAQREATVRLGLEWLQAAGHIAVEGDDELSLAPGTPPANPYAQQEILVAVRGLLEETAAYRRYLAAIVNPEKLLEH